jgi:CubicO group peptidase (beta-lactamase class C family)
MQRYVDAGRPPGIITAVARQGKVVHFECFGLRDVEAGKPMQPDTIVRIASMTKPITSVALMMLFEQGRFLLSDPISKYIPEFASCRVYAGATETGVECVDLERAITIRDLLTHTAGLGYGLLPDSPVEDLYRAAGVFHPQFGLQVSLPELVCRLAELPLAHQPGTVWRYSLAHDVIGHLISVLSDMPFDVFLKERIFDPLGMDETGFYVLQDKLDRFAALYDGTAPGEVKCTDIPATSSFANPNVPPSGGGGLVSTAADYMRFAQMLLNGGVLEGTRLLGRKTLVRMTTNHLPPNLYPVRLTEPWDGMGYGLGFGVVVDETQRPMLTSRGEYGWPGSGGSRFWVDPQEELIGLILAQTQSAGVPHTGVFENLVQQALVD